MEAVKLWKRLCSPLGFLGARKGLVRTPEINLGQNPHPSLAQLIQQELEVNPELLRAADFNEGLLFPLLSSFYWPPLGHGFIGTKTSKKKNG